MSCSRLLLARRLAVRSGFKLSHIQTRSVRTKRGADALEASIKRDERLLKVSHSANTRIACVIIEPTRD